MKLIVIKHSILSGIFASMASVFGKVATTESIFQPLVSQVYTHLEYLPDENYFQYSLWLFRLAVFVLMILANAIMWSQFSLALAFSESTIQVTTLNTFCNFIATATFGYLLFGEQVTLVWSLGITFILIGIILLKQTEEEEVKVE